MQDIRDATVVRIQNDLPLEMETADPDKVRSGLMNANCLRDFTLRFRE